jgi:hypothetical protein
MSIVEKAPPSCTGLRELHVLSNQRRRCRIQIVRSCLNAGVALEQA